MGRILLHRQRPIVLTAALSVAVLLAAIGLQLGAAREPSTKKNMAFERPGSSVPTTYVSDRQDWKEELARLGIISNDADALQTLAGNGTTTDPLTYIDEVVAEQTINGYLSLKENETYSKELANQLGTYIGSNIIPTPTNIPHTKADILRNPDISKKSILSYRSDMREALVPLITDASPEFETFAYYIETKNPARLDELREAAERYKKAESNMLLVSVPENAVDLHLRTLNSLGAYANTLERLVLFADSPLATLALLRTYNEAEREMLYAFDALAEYYVQKAGTQ